MKILCGCVLLFIETLTFAQGFNKRYDAFGWENGQGALGIETTEEGWAVISTSYDVDSIAPDFYLTHASVIFTFIDTEGNKLAERRTYRPMHGTFAGWADCCDDLPTGGFVSGGGTESLDQQHEVYLMRFDQSGDTLWTRVFGDPFLNDYWIGRQAKYMPDGGFLVIGITDANGSRDGFALKTDSLGNEQWRKIYGWSTSEVDGFVSCDVGPANSYYMGGSRFHNDLNGDVWVQRTDSAGELIWRVSWGGEYTDGSGHLITANDGQPLVAYNVRFDATSPPMTKPALAKLDSLDGSIIWDHVYGDFTSTTGLYTVKETINGDLIACGITYTDGGSKGLLLKTNSEGDSLWMRSYFYEDSIITNGQGRFFDVLPTADGGFIAAGAAYNPVGAPYPPGYSADAWVVKVDGDGCIVPGCNSVGIAEQATNLLGALTIWPNPVAPGGQVQIELDLPPSIEARDLELSVVAMDGKVVLRHALNDVTLSPSKGTSYSPQLPQLSPGLYHLHITNGSTWLTGGKLMVE